MPLCTDIQADIYFCLSTNGFIRVQRSGYDGMPGDQSRASYCTSTSQIDEPRRLYTRIYINAPRGSRRDSSAAPAAVLPISDTITTETGRHHGDVYRGPAAAAAVHLNRPAAVAEKSKARIWSGGRPPVCMKLVYAITS